MGNSDSKVELHGIAEVLSEEDLSQNPASQNIIRQFLTLPENKHDFFAILQPESIRAIRNNQPKNLKQLLENAISTLATVAQTKSSQEFDLAMNSVCFLTRVLPYLLEGDQAFHDEFFWSSEGPPLAIVLLRSISLLLFTPGFCIRAKHESSTITNEPGMDSSLLWSPGVGSHECIGHMEKELDKRKVEVLRLFLVCLSSPLFQSARERAESSDPWANFVVSDDSFPHLHVLVCSLLNTALSFGDYGWFSKSDQVQRALATLSTQVLAVILDANPIDENGDECPNRAQLVFSNYLGNDTEGMEFVGTQMCRLFALQYATYKTKDETSEVMCYQELLVVLWKLLDANRMFLTYFLQSHMSNDVVVACCFFILRAYDKHSQVDLVHLCTFLLLLISGERDFGVGLNKEVTVSLPPLGNGSLPKSLNHAELLVFVFHLLMSDPNQRFMSLYNCFLTIMGNFSPYSMGISMPAAVKLVQMFDDLSKPRFLLKNKFAHQHVQSILDIFNNLIQYQYNGNVSLVYALVHRSELIERLSKLPTTQGGIDKMLGSATKVTETEQSDGEAPSEAGTSPESTDFQPTPEWLVGWKNALHLNTTLRMIQYLKPEIEKHCKTEGNAKDVQVLEFLKSTTLVGLLPVPHPIIVRKYQANEYTASWFSTFLWGRIYVNNQEVPLWDGETIEMFQVSLTHD